MLNLISKEREYADINDKRIKRNGKQILSEL